MRLAHLMENTLAYRLWQMPFAREKFAPVAAANELTRVRCVLDVGCGPGTNASYFPHARYVGVDINPAYIEFARNRYNGEFIVADVTDVRITAGELFDFILVNSLLHHLDPISTRRLLDQLAALLTADGHIHVIELVLPESGSIASFLARADRGRFVRPLAEWRQLLDDHFSCTCFQPFTIARFGVPLWQLLYYKGRSKQ